MHRMLLFLSRLIVLHAEIESVTSKQTLNCGIGGRQTMIFASIYPASINQHSSFEIVVGGNSSVRAFVSGATIRNLEWYFVLPGGLCSEPPVIVSEGALVSGGSNGGTLGNVDVRIEKNIITLTASGPIKDRSSFIPPTFKMVVKAVGEVGTLQAIYSQRTPAYRLSAMMINVVCSAVGSDDTTRNLHKDTDADLTAWTATVITPAISNTRSKQQTMTGNKGVTVSASGSPSYVPSPPQ